MVLRVWLLLKDRREISYLWWLTDLHSFVECSDDIVMSSFRCAYYTKLIEDLYLIILGISTFSYTFSALFLFCDCSNTFVKRRCCLTRHQNEEVKSRLKKAGGEIAISCRSCLLGNKCCRIYAILEKILQKTKYCRFKYLNYGNFIFNELLPK